MRIKGIKDEDFVNYKVPSLFVSTATCTWKCCNEAGCDKTMCQNAGLFDQPDKNVSPKFLYARYISNPISKAIVFGGLEPFDQWDELLEMISFFRKHGVNDDIVVYTGYTEKEIPTMLAQLSEFKNIIVKFGRFVPNAQQVFDPVLSVVLASDNQYAKRIS